MKNLKLQVITALFITILLVGCSNSSNGEKTEKNGKDDTEVNNIEQIKQDIPEPYKKAIIAINNKNWELANTYLDLVISDFQDSEYILPTQILKVSMQVSQFQGAYELTDIILGTDPNNSLYDEEDKAAISRHIKLIKDIFNNSLKEQEKTFTTIVQEFKADKDYSKYYKDIMPLSLDGHYSDNLSFFAEVGYPVPSDNEIDEFLNTKYDINLSHMVNEIIEKTENINFNYLLLFYNAGTQLNETNPKLAKDLFNLILNITSDDIYNEYRISVEKFMGDSINDTNKNEELNQTYNNAQANSKNKKYDPFEWGIGVKEEFENQMIQNEYADSKENLFYKNGYTGGDNQGYYEVYTIDENGEERYIVVVNVKTGSYHG
ncbi:hypothetical protein ACIQYL_04420 [Lysinibacillus xylanilyticus]|uniref:hypothetical protein n=1 Tax=Lysinibacillus xylanilyticus TaxID=582475 RepID=UPI0037F964BF